MFARFKGFEIVTCGEINSKSHTLELVRWYESKGKEYCYVVAWLDWNDREPCWELHSVGTRFLDDYEEGLCQYIRAVLKVLDLTKEYNTEE